MVNMRWGLCDTAHQHGRRLWQTEHTAGAIQEGKNERGSRGGNHLKGWMLDSSCHPPLPPAGAYRFAPDPISKRKRKKIAENPQDKPLRAVVRFAILGVSPSDILGFSVSNLSRDRGRMGGMAVGIGWPPPGGHGQGPPQDSYRGLGASWPRELLRP